MKKDEGLSPKIISQTASQKCGGSKESLVHTSTKDEDLGPEFAKAMAWPKVDSSTALPDLRRSRFRSATGTRENRG